jgi:hypothetical protein
MSDPSGQDDCPSDPTSCPVNPPTGTIPSGGTDGSPDGSTNPDTGPGDIEGGWAVVRMSPACAQDPLCSSGMGFTFGGLSDSGGVPPFVNNLFGGGLTFQQIFGFWFADPSNPALQGYVRLFRAYQTSLKAGAIIGPALAIGGGADGGEPVDVGESPVLPDSAFVCRGGLCTADRFANGSDVTIDANGNLQGVSVNSAPNASLEELTSTIKNGQVGVTTVGDIRAAGGDVIPDPTPNNPYHCIMCGISPAQAERLFTPTTPNPSLNP